MERLLAECEARGLPRKCSDPEALAPLVAGLRAYYARRQAEQESREE